MTGARGPLRVCPTACSRSKRYPDRSAGLPERGGRGGCASAALRSRVSRFFGEMGAGAAPALGFRRVPSLLMMLHRPPACRGVRQLVHRLFPRLLGGGHTLTPSAEQAGGRCLPAASSPEGCRPDSPVSSQVGCTHAATRHRPPDGEARGLGRARRATPSCRDSSAPAADREGRGLEGPGDGAEPPSTKPLERRVGPRGLCDCERLRGVGHRPWVHAGHRVKGVCPGLGLGPAGSTTGRACGAGGRSARTQLTLTVSGGPGRCVPRVSCIRVSERHSESGRQQPHPAP